MTYLDLLKKRYSSWKQLEAEIEKLNTSVLKGDAFEQFTYAYFKINAQKYLVQDIYISKEIPDNLIEKYKIGHAKKTDCGVDGLIIRSDGKAFAYQCKFRSGRQKPKYEELTKFWSDGRYCDYCCTVANCYEITDLSDKHEQNLSILVQDFDSLDETFFEQLYELTNSVEDKPHLKKIFYEPFDYQKKIIDDVIEGFSVEDRGKVIAACGTGKTLTSLWIVEQMDVSQVLFLAPSITLVKQTLESWADQAKKDFTYICVCSDNTVNRDIEESDESDIKVSDMGVPVTTDPKQIAAFMGSNDEKKKYIFSTYQSADKISEAQKISQSTFDLIICDEAHRTVGTRSNFSIALEDRNIRSKKRLFMTATERMIRPMLLRRMENNGEVVFSMDDESKYGPLFSRYNFGDAIKDETISDYKIVVAGVKEREVYDYIQQNTNLRLTDIEDEERVVTAEALYAKILLSKTMHEFPIHKVISFHSSIARSRNFIANNDQNVPLKNIIRQFNDHIEDNDIYIDNISCEVPAADRAKILREFKESEYGIISNAKCLTEGVDVPIIDSVYFVDQKKSLVDIVQACGRALRTKKGTKKTAYFIIPILFPESGVSTDILYSEKFDAVYNIIQALRDQDNRLEDWINKLNKKYVSGGGVGGDSTDDNPIIIDIQGIDVDLFSEELMVKIATVNATSNSQQMFGPGARTAGQTRLFKPIVDMTSETLINNLVIPTMMYFKESKRRIMSASEIRFNHNNVSHTLKLGLIQKEGTGIYGLTPLGEEYLKDRYTNEALIKRQLMRYSCSVEDQNIERVLFPYRAIFEILKDLPGRKSLSFLEFAFCIYTMPDSKRTSVIRAVQGIQYLRANYPNIHMINDSNKETVLQELNSYFGSTLSMMDVWGSRATTVKNQYMYFRNHLSIYDDLIRINSNKEIELITGEGQDLKLKRLLELDQEMVKLPRNSLIAKYTEALFVLLLFSI